MYDNDIEPLTPNHLLYGGQLHFNNYKDSVKDRVFVNDGVEDGVFVVHKRIEYLKTMVNHFWNKWRSKYIPSLLEYQKLNDKIKSHHQLVILQIYTTTKYLVSNGYLEAFMPSLRVKMAKLNG